MLRRSVGINFSTFPAQALPCSGSTGIISASPSRFVGGPRFRGGDEHPGNLISKPFPTRLSRVGISKRAYKYTLKSFFERAVTLRSPFPSHQKTRLMKKSLLAFFVLFICV